jgi:integrase
MLAVRAVTEPKNAVDDRRKNFLTEAEIEIFLKAARKGRHSIRNFAMLLLAFRHGLRVTELINMRMADLDLDTGRLFVRRLKGSLSTSHPLEGDEIRALRAWLRRRINAPCCNSPLVFLCKYETGNISDCRNVKSQFRLFTMRLQLIWVNKGGFEPSRLRDKSRKSRWILILPNI